MRSRKQPRTICEFCGEEVAVTRRGLLRVHGYFNRPGAYTNHEDGTVTRVMCIGAGTVATNPIRRERS